MSGCITVRIRNCLCLEGKHTLDLHIKEKEHLTSLELWGSILKFCPCFAEKHGLDSLGQWPNSFVLLRDSKTLESEALISKGDIVHVISLMAGG